MEYRGEEDGDWASEAGAHEGDGKMDGERKDAVYWEEVDGGTRVSGVGGPGNVASPSANLPALHGVRDGIVKQLMEELGHKGEVLNIVAVGGSGLGKTTLLSCLFSKDIRATSGQDPPIRTRGIHEMVINFDLEGVPFTITLTDTPGFGDFLDLEESFNTVTTYLEYCNARAFQEEIGVVRSKRYQDYLIDAVLYFLSPHKITEIDLEMLARLNNQAPVIPILAKSDCMTPMELEVFKKEVVRTLDENDIAYFHEPFAVVSSLVTTEGHDGKPGNAIRRYPWGSVDVENEDHSELPALRRCILTEGLGELKAAKNALYEGYRFRALRKEEPSFKRKLIRGALRTALRIVGLVIIAPYVLKAQQAVTDKITGGSKDSEEERGMHPAGFFGRLVR